MGNKNEKWVDPQIDPRVTEAVRKLAAQGCAGAKASTYWRMYHVPQDGPWMVSRSCLVPSAYLEQPVYTLGGEGTIAEHLASLALFSLETGYLPLNWVSIHGRDCFSGRVRLLDIGGEGFRIRRDENRVLILYRHIGPGDGLRNFEVVARHIPSVPRE